MATSAAMVSLALKFRGCLVGSHIGDCLGAPFEGDSPISKSVLSGYFTKFLKDPAEGSIVQTQPYTDDTAMTVAVADSLTAKGVFDPVDLAKRFVDEYVQQPRRGYGQNVVHVFHSLSKTDFNDVFQPAKLQFNGSGSYGNGAAMRIAPVALYCCNHDEEMLKELAKNSSLITHTHQNGYNGAILQCLAVHQALKCDPSKTFNPVQFTDSLLKKMQAIENPIENVGSFEQKKPYCNSLKTIKELFEKQTSNPSPVTIADLLGNHISAHKSVPTAIYCFLRGMQPLEDFESNNPFVRAIYFAISVGGDTDTIAAMTGSIAGAYYGLESIPMSMQRRCEALDSSLAMADKLLTLISAN